MKRLINSTGRKKIDLENIIIRLEDGVEPGSPPSFKAQITIPENLRLDRNARVYLEPYVRSSSMRFDFGTVGQIIHPAETVLADLDAGSDVLFRLRVVDESGYIGRILAAANEIRPRYEADDSVGRRSLLTLVSMNLGEELWKVSVSGAAPPVLQVNNQVPGLRDKLRNDPVLQGSVYPDALRTVLNHIVFTGPGDDDTAWIKDWKAFTEELRGEEWPEELNPEEDKNGLDDFIDETVIRYCDLLKFATVAKASAERALDE